MCMSMYGIAISCKGQNARVYSSESAADPESINIYRYYIHIHTHICSYIHMCMSMYVIAISCKGQNARVYSSESAADPAGRGGGSCPNPKGRARGIRRPPRPPLSPSDASSRQHQRQCRLRSRLHHRLHRRYQRCHFQLRRRFHRCRRRRRRCHRRCHRFHRRRLHRCQLRAAGWWRGPQTCIPSSSSAGHVRRAGPPPQPEAINEVRVILLLVQVRTERSSQQLRTLRAVSRTLSVTQPLGRRATPISQSSRRE